MSREYLLLLILAGFVIVEIYVYQALRVVLRKTKGRLKKVAIGFYWGVPILSLGLLVLTRSVDFGHFGRFLQIGSAFVMFANFVAKLFVFPFLVIDDVRRLFLYIKRLLKKNQIAVVTPESKRISRSAFLAKSGLIMSALPLVSLSYGIIAGAYDYRIRKRRIKLPHLPKAFDGITIAQLSDIHSGSFFNKVAVAGGVEMLLHEKPDLIFFTGDLVNNKTDEVKDYIPIFSKLKAPLGVYSTLGNHDYGDYQSWSSAKAKQQNLMDMLEAHKILGWDLLMNESRLIGEQDEKLAIIGVENWGKGRFAKYGQLDKACEGTEEAAVKLLLSHDPSHWDAQVRIEHPDIDMMFAGHTHGFQFGVEIGQFKWSPSKYIYKQWDDLYQEGKQYLYVNRGFGFIGFPGRVGILPEITIVELVRG